MKTRFFALLAVCLLICGCCASVKPTPEPPAAVGAPPATNSAITQIVSDWWETPPPDYQTSQDGGDWGWCLFGHVLEVLGTLLCK